MKFFISSLVLLSLLFGIYCQRSAVFTERTITPGDNFLTNQRVQACSNAIYNITNLPDPKTGDILTILFVPRTDSKTPPPSSDVTISLQTLDGFYDFPISSVINQTFNSITYLSQSDGCQIDGGQLVRAPGNVNSGCGINYYCSFLFTGMRIIVSTTNSENEEGILFDLNVRITSVPIAPIQFNSILTTTTTVPMGILPFKPTIAQKHYKVSFANRTSIYDSANFLSEINSMSVIRFSLTNLKVNGVNATGDQGIWSLNFNQYDIAQADNNILLTDPQQPCFIASVTDPNFYSGNTKLVIDINACDLSIEEFYISVGMPLNNNTYTYDLLVTSVPMEGSYLPNYKNLTVNNPINDVIADYIYFDTPAINYYLLNISSANFQKGDYFFITVSGISYGSASIQITQGCYGYGITCGECDVIAECNQFNYFDFSPDEALDYCKLKVDPCDITVDNSLPFYVTVKGNIFESNFWYNYDYVSYTISLEIKKSVPKDITTFTKTIGDGWVEYVYKGQVRELDYDHFVWNFDLSTVNEFYLLTTHMFVDQEKDEVIYTHNVGSLAGSGTYISIERDFWYYVGYADNFDSCYSNDYACNTRLKVEYNSPYYVIDQIGSCRATLAYCDILRGSSHYFSVYGVNSSPNSYISQLYNNYGLAGLGYNRAVEYTAVWRLYTAPQTLADSTVVSGYVNMNDLTYLQYFYSPNETYYVDVRPNQLTNTYTRQYVYNIPKDVTADSVRIILSDLIPLELNNIVAATMFASCGKPAGSCPCYQYDDFCNIGSRDFCEIYISLCDCQGPIYVSILSNFNLHGVAPFTLAAFAQTSELKSTLNFTQNKISVSNNLVPNSGFNPIAVNQRGVIYNQLDYFFQKYSFTSAIIYSADLYKIPKGSYSSTSSLRFSLRYIHTPGKQQFDQFAILSIGNGVIPPSSPFLSDCVESCFAFGSHEYDNPEGSLYCTISIDPCELQGYDDIYIRVYGVMPFFYFDEFTGYDYYQSGLSFAGITYTLNANIDNYAPVLLSIATPHYDRLFETQYRHYSLVLPKIPAALNIFMYRNSDEIGDLSLYYNSASLAGDEPCYEYEDRCQIIEGNTLSSTCQIFIPMCEYTKHAGKTIFFSVRNEREHFTRNFNFSEIQHIPGGMPLEYTITPEISVLQSIDLNKGIPITGNLRSQQEAYYSFTITQADIDAGKIFNIEVDSIEPYLGENIITYIGTENPSNSCGCANAESILVDGFRYSSFTCDLLGRAGTYYVIVSAKRDGVTVDNPFNPVSYTIRGWFIPPVVPIQNLAISETTYTIPPFPLNMNQFIIYKVNYTRQLDSTLVIELADLQSTLESAYSNGVEVIVNFGHPGSDSVSPPLFNSNFCFLRTCIAQNLESEELPAGTVMCRIIISPCETTDQDTTLYITVFPLIEAPEPRIQFRANYTLRVYNKPVATLDFFPDSSAYRTAALAEGGYSFTINNIAEPTIKCDARFGNIVWDDFYFRLSSIQVNQYEEFNILNSLSNENSYFFFQDGAIPSELGCPVCSIVEGDSCTFQNGCTVGSKLSNIYGALGFSVCEGSQSGSANGVTFVSTILNDRVYTQLPTIQMTINNRVNSTLSPGQFVILQFNFSQVVMDLYPVTTYSLKLSNNQTASERTCYSTSTPFSPNSAVIFPGTIEAESSYCSFCNDALPTTPILSSCCVDPNEIAYLTVYNPPNSGVTFTYEYQVLVEYLASSYSKLTLPIQTSFTSVSPTNPVTFSFDLQNMLQLDLGTSLTSTALNLRFRSSNGTAQVYLNAFKSALPGSDCTSPMYSCLTSDADNCIIQVPACELAAWANSHYLYEMFVAIVSHNSNTFVGTVEVDIFIQNAIQVSFPSTTPFPTGFVPDQTYVPVNYYNFYKFQINRKIGELQLNDSMAGYKISLIPLGTPNSLQLSVNYPTLDTSNDNPFAGNPTTGDSPNCTYSHDSDWKCYRTNDIGGPETRMTLGNEGVTCILSFCNPDYNNLLINNRFIYFSVQNVATTSRVVSNYQVVVDYYYEDLPSTEVQYSITPAATVSNPNILCTTMGNNVGGCSYLGNFTEAYFLVNLQNITQWGVTDYLVFNVTDFTNDIQISTWSDRLCEISSSLTCTEGTECVLQFDPCTFTSFFRADPGSNRNYAVSANNIYVRISGLKSSTTFKFFAMKYTPFMMTLALNSSVPRFSETFIASPRSFTMFNFETQKDENYDFRVIVSSTCPNRNITIYRNYNNAKWATASCRDVGAFTNRAVITERRCDAQGNHFVTVYVPPNLQNYDTNEQVTFSVSASIIKTVFKTVDYCWECSEQISGTTNLIVEGDNENYGTSVSVTLTSSDNLSMRIISPLYREASSVISQSYLDGFDSCSLPACTARGVYCCNNDVDLEGTTQFCTINIPACDYRNGRFFIIADVDGPAVVVSKIFRQDYPILTVGQSNMYQLTVQGEIPLGPIVASPYYYDTLGNDYGAELPYYQFYKIVPSGDPYFLQVKVQTFVRDLFYNEFVTNYDYDDYYIQYPELVVSLRRGESPVSTTVHCSECSSLNCETAYCKSPTPGTCYLGDTNCVASVYYLSVSFEKEFYDFFYENCDLIQYEITVIGRNVEPIERTLTVNETLTICGSVQGITYNPNGFPEAYSVDDDNGDDYDLYDEDNEPIDSFPIIYALHDEAAGTYPQSQTYHIDTSALGEHDDIGISFYLRPLIEYLSNIVEGDIILSISTQNPATPFCNDCELTTRSIDMYQTGQEFIICPNLTNSDLWLTVTATRRNLLILDYVISVIPYHYEVVTPVLPALQAGVPVPVQITVGDVSTVTPFTPNGQYAVVRNDDDLLFYTDIDYKRDCLSGCPQVEAGCTFLGSKEQYYVYSDSSTTVDIQMIHTVHITSNATSFTSTIPAGGYELIYVSFDILLTFNSLSMYVESATSDIIVDVSYDGFTAGSDCENDLFASFNTTTDVTLQATYRNPQETCDTNGVYLTVYQSSTCGLGATKFSLGFVLKPLEPALSVQQLPTNFDWVAGTLPVYGGQYSTLTRVYEIKTTNEEVIVVNLANVNNTVNSSMIMSVSSDSCSVAGCSTDNSGACFAVISPVIPNSSYYVFLGTGNSLSSSFASAITYKIQATNSLPNLETTMNNRYQILPSNYHVYQVNARQGGSPTGPIQSVVINVEMIDGNPLFILVQDSLSSLTWTRFKACDFGTCTFEIPTRAQHPGAPVLYVLVFIDTSVSLTTNKPTNYKIHATTGLGNCESTASFISGFCLPTVTTLTNVYRYRDADARNFEAESRVSKLSCKCPTPQADCIAKLTRFSCLESFRECDSNGFWTPLCRNECDDVVSTCGEWHSQNANCTCERPEFSCGSARYSDDASNMCTGRQALPTPSASPNPSPSSSPSKSFIPSRSSAPSTSSVPSVSPSPSEEPEPSDNDTYRTYFIVNGASNLSFNVAVFMVLVSFILF